MDYTVRGYRAKNRIKMNDLNGFGIGSSSDALLIIQLPDSRVLRIVSRSFFLAIVLVALLSIGFLKRDSPNAWYESDANLDIDCSDILPILFRDLVGEGLVKEGNRGLVLGARTGDVESDLEILNEKRIDLVIESDLNRRILSQNEVFDFVLALRLSFRSNIELIDDVLRSGGIVIAPLSNDSPNVFLEKTSYKMVYLQRFEYKEFYDIPSIENTMMALKKSGESKGFMNCPTKDVSCGTVSDVKKLALKGLEDVYLEPPRRAWAKSSFGSRKLKFLPDLMRDSLENYPRRIFITDDTSALDWFSNNYPMRDQFFEIYNMEIEINDESMSEVVSLDMGISEWLMKTMKREDYVVMKAEARAVEEMMKDGTICLVDELFLECNNQWQDGDENGSKRPYWQCLALYGKLRDEGIAVHQWWG